MTEMLFLKDQTPEQWRQAAATTHAAQYERLLTTHSSWDKDANCFIQTRGDDCLTVDHGYSKAKLTRHHSTLLIDGKGQCLDGDKDLYKGLTEEWGGRLDNWFVADSAVFMRGKAAGAYPADTTLSKSMRLNPKGQRLPQNMIWN